MSSSGFWKPSSSLSADDGEDEYLLYRRRNTSTTPLSQQRLLLPIYQHKTQILYSVEHFGVVVIQGETGSGKSTQICQYLYEQGWADHGFQIVCAQPRPMAAQTLARRVAQEIMSSSSSSSSSYNNNTSSSLVGSIVDWEDPFKCKHARIVFTTHSVLLREAACFDPLLSRYSVILVDEVHERTLASDALLGVLAKLRRQRQDSLRIILCSATMDASACLEFFVGPTAAGTTNEITATTITSKQEPPPQPPTITTGKAATNLPHDTSSHERKRGQSRWGSKVVQDKVNSTEPLQDVAPPDTSPPLKTYQRGTILSVDGRQYPVDVMYLSEPTPEYIRSTVETALQLHFHGGDDTTGDILCFLPSAEDIDRAIRLAEEQLDQNVAAQSTTTLALPALLALHSSLPYQMQAEVLFHQPNSSTKSRNHHQQEPQQHTRRIIMATNMAETSVTVPNVTHVIDCGFVTLPYFDPKTGVERWLVAPISQASAHQRAGRAGRQRPGVCYRLYTELYFLQTMEPTTPPEILRTNLTGLILTLKALGVSNLLSFDLLDMPSVDALSHGLECLYALGAMTDQTHLTPRGLQMSAFPTDPQVARMLLESLDLQCSWEALAVASAMQLRPTWLLLPPSRSPSQRNQYHQARSEYIDASGDHVTMANIIASEHDNDWSASSDQECRERYINPTALRRALEIRRQLAKVLRTFGKVEALVGSVMDPDLRSQSIRRCVTAGFFVGNVAKLGQDGRYYTLYGGQHVMVTPSPASVFATHGRVSEYIVFGETVSHQDGAHQGGNIGGSSSSSGGGVQVRWCSAIEAKWLREIGPHYWQ